MGSTYLKKLGQWGEYLKFKTELDSQYVTKKERQGIQRKYSQQFGTTTFNSRSTIRKKFVKGEEKFAFPIFTAFRKNELVDIDKENANAESGFKKEFMD